MITKIRSGVFETNSSSTHTCVLCSHDVYVRWCKGELAWNDQNIHIRNLINKYSKQDYIVEEDFIDVRAFKDIKVDKVFEIDDFLLKYYNKKATKYTIDDFWKVYITFDYQRIKDWYIEDDFKEAFNDAKERFLEFNLEEMQEIMNSFNQYTYSPVDIMFDSWTNFFSMILGVFPVNNVRIPGCEEEAITKKIIDGKEIIAYCTHGHD